MIFTVSTVKDSLTNIEAFCRRNLAAGADHLFLFLDAPDAEVEEWLAAQPHVTALVTDDRYWVPDRPESLNARQVTNANLAMCLLAGFEWADWIFHIDADECLQIDREKLLAKVPADRAVVRIAPLEAVSQMHWAGEVTHFKPMLERDRIDDLVARGLIEAPEADEPANATWFRGHVQGKIGVRPDLDTRMQLHRAVRQGDEEVQAAFARPWLAHRHYESHSGEEFIRKWLAHLSAGQVRFRPRRGRLQASIRRVVDDPGLDEAGRRAALTEIYHQDIEDDLAALRELGVLVEPVDGHHTPEDFPPGGRELMDRLLGLLMSADKRYLNPQLTDFWPVELFEQVRAGLPASDPLVPVLQRAIDTARASESARGVVHPKRAGRLGRLLGRG